MPKLIYSMSMSLDGFIAGPDDNFDWGAPDEELHRFHNERVRALGGHLLGRRLYETMKYWETAHEDPAATDYALEFAEIWKALPKVVFSDSLDEVVGNTRLAQGDIAEEVAELQERSGRDVAIGGADLAAKAIELGLVDVFQPFVTPWSSAGGSRSSRPSPRVFRCSWLRRRPSDRGSSTSVTNGRERRSVASCQRSSTSPMPDRRFTPRAWENVRDDDGHAP